MSLARRVQLPQLPAGFGALTAAAVAALTVYDMTKALDKSIEIQDLYLIEKTGGKSGDYKRKKDKG